MNKSTLLIAVVSIFMMYACNSQTEKEKEEKTEADKYLSLINKADWLIGSWENNTPEGLLIEKWEKLNDTTLGGISYVTKGTDTLFSETMNLELKDDKLLYVPTVKDQNNAMPVIFTATSISEKEMVFENPTHDFPQKIMYRQITQDSLVAEVSAIVNGKEKKEIFSMKKNK